MAESNENLTTDQQQAQTQQAQLDPQMQFMIHRVYLKDLSIESPNSPYVFQQEWHPEIEINLNVEHKEISDLVEHGYEVALVVRLTARLQEKTAILVEATESGIFTVTGATGEVLEHILMVLCPNILFAYVREIIADSMMRAGLQPVHLAPMNFDLLWEEHKKKSKGATQA